MTFYAHMLTQTVDIEPFTGPDVSDGSPTYGAIKTDVDARVERGVEVSFGGEGARDEVATVVWLAESVDSDDRIHLPGGRVVEVRQVEQVPTTDGRTSIWKVAG